ncbi:hypothetical protein MLD38_004288 [Melastoma candidum]|uniref:Uncharacterized protein n=1 Tax=Melastoma candidum TaxID=119954 RepID=A0ACB9S594_9MYRT|nr:hypothetical protein MLD38_004288 [Melastoma candidum]
MSSEPLLPADEQPPTSANASAAPSEFSPPSPAPPPLSDNPAPPKRQRRPSVRLGDIGDQASLGALSIDLPSQSQSRRPKHSSSASKSLKARSVSHLVNGDTAHGSNLAEADEKGRQGELNPELFGYGKKVKSRRGAPVKRPRSVWTSSKVDHGNEVRNREREELYSMEEVGQDEEESRDFAPEVDSPVKENDDNDAAAFSGEVMWRWRRNEEEGVRNWLVELGLSRYVPVFEIHEVDEEVLPLLTLEDLKDMGINAVGSRRKMFSAIQKLRKGLS